MKERCHGHGGRGEQPERHEREGLARVCAVLARLIKGGEEEKHADKRADRKEYYAHIIERMGHERRIRCEEHIRLSGEHHGIGQERAPEHEYVGQPAHLGGREPGVEDDRASDVKRGDLEEYYPHYEHVEAVRRKNPVEPFRRQEMHRGPARKRGPERRQAAYCYEDYGRHRIGLYQPLRRQMHLKPGYGTSPEILLRHVVPPYLTISLPTIV